MAKKVKAVTGDSMTRLNRISPLSNFLFNALFLTLALMCFLPIIFIAIISLTDNNVIRTQGYQLWLTAETISADAYAYLWTQRQTILHSLWVSIYVTAIGTVIGVALTTVMGYVLSRTEHKLNNFLTILIFIPMVFGGGMAASYVVNTQVMKLTDSMWALILPLAVSSWNVTISRTFFKSTIPDSIIESGKIDGASQLRIFVQLVLPICLPAIATIALFLTFAYWNEWYLASIYISTSRTDLFPLQFVLVNIENKIQFLINNANYVSADSQDLPSETMRMAIVVIAVVPIMFSYPFFQKYYISGLTVGAVKG